MKTLIIVSLFCAATMITGLRTGFAYDDYGPANCKDCHLGFETVHAQHDPLLDCNACHVDGQTTPKPSKCAVCHPVGDTGTCPLVYVHDAIGASCRDCHIPTCAELPCETDADCDDDLFCTGIESCSGEVSSTVCVAGTDPCTGDKPACVEETDTCVECLNDEDCAGEATCEDNECIDACPAGTPPEVLTFDGNGDCLLNKEELKNYNDTLKIAQSAEKTALKTKHSLEKEKYKAIKVNFSN